LAVLFSIVNLFAAWAFVLHFAFIGKNGSGGETIILYLTGCVSLFFSGAGKFSIDSLIAGSRDKTIANPKNSMAQAKIVGGDCDESWGCIESSAGSS
jgi:hypothetical protein